MGKMKNTYGVLMEKSKGMRLLGKSRHLYKKYLTETG